MRIVLEIPIKTLYFLALSTAFDEAAGFPRRSFAFKTHLLLTSWSLSMVTSPKTGPNLTASKTEKKLMVRMQEKRLNTLTIDGLFKLGIHEL